MNYTLEYFGLTRIHNKISIDRGISFLSPWPSMLKIEFNALISNIETRWNRKINLEEQKALKELLKNNANIVVAYKIWSLAQTLPGESIDDAINRINDLLPIIPKDVYCIIKSPSQTLLGIFGSKKLAEGWINNNDNNKLCHILEYHLNQIKEEKEK